MSKVEFYATLTNQTRDDEDEVTIKFKAPATEFGKVIMIPTRKLLKVIVEVTSKHVNPMTDSQELDSITTDSD